MINFVLSSLNENNLLAGLIALAILLVTGTTCILFLVLRYKKHKKSIDDKLKERERMQEESAEAKKGLNEQVVDGEGQQAENEQKEGLTGDMEVATPDREEDENSTKINEQVEKSLNEKSSGPSAKKENGPVEQKLKKKLLQTSTTTRNIERGGSSAVAKTEGLKGAPSKTHVAKLDGVTKSSGLKQISVKKADAKQVGGEGKLK